MQKVESINNWKINHGAEHERLRPVERTCITFFQTVIVQFAADGMFVGKHFPNITRPLMMNTKNWPYCLYLALASVRLSLSCSSHNSGPTTRNIGYWHTFSAD